MSRALKLGPEASFAVIDLRAADRDGSVQKAKLLDLTPSCHYVVCNLS